MLGGARHGVRSSPARVSHARRGPGVRQPRPRLPRNAAAPPHKRGASG